MNERNGSISRRGRIAGVGLLFLLLTFALGNRACDNREPTIHCSDLVDIVVTRGTCRAFPNPCSEHGEGWALPPDTDGIRFEPANDTQRALIAAEQARIQTVRGEGGDVVRSVCVGDNAPITFIDGIGFFYGRGDRFGLGTFRLTVPNTLAVAVTASHPHIQPGDFTLLVADQSGGLGPFSYTWTPNTGLDNPDSSGTFARPVATTTYTVLVRDSSGQQASGTVTVFVGPRLAVTVDPQTIELGQASQLTVIAEGGVPPYTYSWTPADTLTNPQSSTPIARPTTTTTYNVTVTDSAGETSNGGTRVIVTNNIPLTASFTYSIGSGPSVRLNASGSTGQITSYIWDLSWTPASPDLVTTSPFATLPIRETDFGTITLTVVDAAGNRATSSQPF